ncbi:MULTISPECIES: hypothetical protein [Pseudomonas]|nr:MULTISPECIES: hypothetical protein [Pseudomonas]
MSPESTRLTKQPETIRLSGVLPVKFRMAVMTWTEVHGSFMGTHS